MDITKDELVVEWRKDQQRQSKFIEYAITWMDHARNKGYVCSILEKFWARRSGKTWTLKEIAKHYMKTGKNEIIHFIRGGNPTDPEYMLEMLLAKDLGVECVDGKVSYNGNLLVCTDKVEEECTLVILDDFTFLSLDFLNQCYKPVVGLSSPNTEEDKFFKPTQ